MLCFCGPHLLLVSQLVSKLQVNKWSRKLWAAVLAEFLGMTIFEIYGGNAPNSVAAYGNGITLGILGKSQTHCLSNLTMQRTPAENMDFLPIAHGWHHLFLAHDLIFASVT